MKIIVHRRNRVVDLENTPVAYGVEIDIRSHGSRLIVHHDPFADAADLHDWLRHFRHGTLIFNVKEAGLEYRVKEAAELHNIADYFFLDLPFPDLIKLLATGERRVAVRFSEFEPLETAMALAGKAQWVWVDCFTKMPLTEESYQQLSRHFKICVVSPELQGENFSKISEFKEQLKPFNIDAVCTKRPDLWLDPESSSRH